MPWYDQLEALRAQPPDATPAELMKALNLGKSQVSDLQAIDKCFDLAAVEKVRAAASPQQTGISSPSGTQKANNLPYTLSFRSALALAGLKKVKLADFNQTFHAALDVTLSLQLTTVQIVALVDWITKGNSPETFDPPEPGKKGKSYKGTKGKTLETAEGEPPNGDKPDDNQKVDELFNKVKEEIARNDGQTTYQDELKALLKKKIVSVEAEKDSGKKEKGGKKSKSASGSQSGWFWEMLLGVKFVSQLRSRAKKGELTTTDKVLVLLYFMVGKPLELIFEYLGKLLKGAAKDFWLWAKHTLGKTFTGIIQWAVPLLIICALIWGLGKVYQYVVVNPLHWVESEVRSRFHHEDITPAQTPIPAPVSVPPPVPPQTSISKGLGQPKRVSRPVASSPYTSSVSGQSNRTPLHEASAQTQVYQPSVSFAPPASPSNSSGVLTTLYDPKLLEEEIAALPKNCIVKAYPLSPDENMPWDMAVSRLQDLIDPDKYTMFIGSSKEKITFITPNNTNLIITYKSTDPFDIWGSSGPINIFWEDVLYIHTDAIYSGASVLPSHVARLEASQQVAPEIKPQVYQLSLVSSSSKYALTIQCATAADMSHLASTLEYFIRHSRLGHDTALAALPYPAQGVWLNNDCVVEKLWANSPVDKAGVKLGDHLLSVGKLTSEQQNKNDLEKSLSSSAVFYAASSADWDKALIDSRAPGEGNPFRPKLRKVILNL